MTAWVFSLHRDAQGKDKMSQGFDWYDSHSNPKEDPDDTPFYHLSNIPWNSSYKNGLSRVNLIVFRSDEYPSWIILLSVEKWVRWRLGMYVMIASGGFRSVGLCLPDDCWYLQNIKPHFISKTFDEPWVQVDGLYSIITWWLMCSAYSLGVYKFKDRLQLVLSHDYLGLHRESWGHMIERYIMIEAVLIHIVVC